MTADSKTEPIDKLIDLLNDMRTRCMKCAGLGGGCQTVQLALLTAQYTRQAMKLLDPGIDDRREHSGERCNRLPCPLAFCDWARDWQEPPSVVDRE
jgi:hypothetical protein